MQANRGARAPRPRPTPTGGFTLIELLVVIAIMGILIGFILVAAQDGVRRSQERATQSLITKLESGVSDRLEAILLQRAQVSLGHQAMGAIVNASFPAVVAGDPNYSVVSGLMALGYLSSNQVALSSQRAQVIANFDMVRAQMPDVFFVQSANPSGAGAYPINFAGLDFPYSGSGTNSFLVPLGAWNRSQSGTGNVNQPGVNPSTGVDEPGDPNQAIGIYGASFAVAGGIYKNLGYLPQGYDGADNNGDGYVDDWAEGTNASNQAQVLSNLRAHTHNTARSEMLYAMLVEGGGPMGSVFNRDDFTAREVQDTDGDGLPEFVDAWGQPLQFFRWPIYYNNLSDTTTGTTTAGSAPTGYVGKGTDPYNGPSEPRQTDPLDPNQTLVSLAWWTQLSSNAKSTSAATFENYFHSLTDPNFTAGTATGYYWDRGGYCARRAYYSRFLILSGGPDETPGVAIAQSVPAGTVAGASYLINTESPTQLNTNTPGSGVDDITNQGLATPGGGTL